MRHDHLGQCAFWLYMHREILKKAAKCKPCTETGEKIKHIIPASKWQPLVNCSETYKETQIDIIGLITSKKDQDIHCLARIDCFSKYPTVKKL